MANMTDEQRAEAMRAIRERLVMILHPDATRFSAQHDASMALALLDQTGDWRL